MKELSQDKETNQQKFAVFQARIERKKAYVQAIDEAITEGIAYAKHKDTSAFDRARTWVWIFEMKEKANAQRALLGQHISYLNQMQELADEQNL